MWTPPIGLVFMIPEISRVCIRNLCTNVGAKYSRADVIQSKVFLVYKMSLASGGEGEEDECNN